MFFKKGNAINIIFFIIFLVVVSFLSFCTKTDSEKSVDKLEKESMKEKKGSFEDIILSSFPEDSFTELDIFYKLRGVNNENNMLEPGYTHNDMKTTNDVLNYFKKLELKEIKRDSIPDKIYRNPMYYISFDDAKNYSSLMLEVLDKKYIKVVTTVYKNKYIDKKKKISKFKAYRERSFYKICNPEVNLQYIRNIFESVDKN